MAVCSWCRGEMTTADSCTATAFHRNGREYPHIRFGSEPGPDRPTGARCGDCGVARGGFHHPGCDLQPCPACGRQLLSCGCLFDEDGEIDECDCEDCADWPDDDALFDLCDCDICSGVGATPEAMAAAISDVMMRMAFTEVMRGLSGATDGDAVEGVLAEVMERAEPVGVDSNGTVTLTSQIGDVEMILRHGEYPDCDVLELDGFAMTTPLRSLIDRATEVSEIELRQNLARFMTFGFVTPADAWRRIAQPDMVDNPGAAILRRILPPTPLGD